jgi:hypothetical protein
MMTGVMTFAVTGTVFAQSGTPAGSPSQAASPTPVTTTSTTNTPQPNAGNAPQPAAGSNVVVTYPAAPFQHPSILQNVLQMRATSPRPNAFLGGAYNPVYRTVTPPTYIYRPVYYRDYGYPYGVPAGYGYFVPVDPLPVGYVLPSSIGQPVPYPYYPAYGSAVPVYLPR